MEVLIPIIAILATFGVPAYMFKRIMDYKERKLELASASNKQLEANNEERQALLARVEALEGVVLDGDYELNQQIRLAAKADQAKRLAAGAETASEKDG